jgi:flap endonuclease-1
VGVDLGELFPGTEITMESLGGKVVAIDAFNQLYQFLAIIRGPDGTPLKDDQGRVTSHLNGLFNRTTNLAVAGVLPIFVFDGAPHPLKQKTIEERSRIKRQAIADYEEALKVGDLERARSKAQQTSTLTSEMIGQAKALIQALGLPIVQAPSEGEAQASFLAREGVAHACGSQDFDSLLFGSPRLVRNLSVTGRRRMPGRQAYVDVSPEIILLEDALATHGLSREQLIDVALLIGTDFNPGVVGIGPKTALKLVKEAGSVENALERAPRETAASWGKLASGAAGLGDVATIRSLFLQPSVEHSPKVVWGRFDRKQITDLLVREHRFSAERVESALGKLETAPIYRRQKSLSDWA